MFARTEDPTARTYCQLGEDNGIGATAHLLRIDNKNIIVDFGISISRNGAFQVQDYPAGDFLIGTEVDMIIITHAHLDHIGAIIPLIDAHPEAIVIVHQMALEAMKILLADSIKIMDSEIRKARNAGIDEDRLPKMTFDIKMLEAFIARTESPDDGVTIVHSEGWYTFGPEWPNWDLGFFLSGHDIGAMSILAVPPDQKPIYLTGDIASHDQEILDGVLVPEYDSEVWDLPGLTMITEATNGAKTDISWSSGKDRHIVDSIPQLDDQLLKILIEVKARGGIVQIATFAKNRGANMVVKVIRLGFKAAIDGMLRKLIRIELGDELVDQLITKGKLIIVDENDPVTAASQRQALINGSYGFAVIIAPSATLDQGFAVQYAERLLPDPKNALIFPGYMFPDSTARQIIEIARGRTVNLNVFRRNERGRMYNETIPVNVRCDVYHFDYTSHDYQQGLVERVLRVRPAKLIIHHCDDTAYETFVSVLRMKLDYSPEIVRGAHLVEIGI